MIESTSLFLSFSYLACGLAHIKRPRLATGVLVVAFGVLASCVKITTFFPFLVALVSYMLADAIGRQFNTLLVGPSISGAILFCLPPVLATYLWTHFADSEKTQNVLGTLLTSTSLTGWNFGTLVQRSRLETWMTIFGRASHCVGGVYSVVLLAIGASISRRRISETICCLIPFFVTPLVFTNLYYHHEYYQYATVVFLIGAVGFVITGIIEAGGRVSCLGPTLACTIVAGSIVHYSTDYWVRQTCDHPSPWGWNRGLEPVCNEIERATAPDDVIVILGCAWSPEIPYYCRRRALMYPGPMGNPLRDTLESFNAQFAHLLETEEKIGAVVVHNLNSNLDHAHLQEVIRRAGVSPVPSVLLGDFEVYHVKEKAGVRK